jgi:predicted metal-binding membrane protein
MTPNVRTERVLVPALVGMVGLAWVSLWLWTRSPYGSLLDHSAHPAGGWSVYVPVAGWALMLVAMMLPTSAPLVALFHSFVRSRGNAGTLTALLVAGYLMIWALIGLVLHAGDHLARIALDQSRWLDTHAWLIGTVVVTTAGLYQFTSLKRRCLEKCRSPLAFIMEHWHGEDGEREAFRLGVHHGLFCIGCCWTLMLLMFLVSIGNLGWMLALAAVMAVEKNVAWGRHLSAPLGAALVATGAVLVAAHTMSLH